MIHEGSINIPFTYAAGEGGSRFLLALRDERQILGARCAACARVYCPGRSFCPECGADALEWSPVGPEGTIVAWTHVPDKGLFGLVRLDGADTPMTHRLIGAPTHYRVGTRVRARFALERTGSILDLEGFVATGEPAT